MKTLFKGKFIPLNVQLFAENNGNEASSTSENNTSGEQPTSVSKQDYDKLVAEMQKLRTANDKLSSENAEHKRKNKEKLTEEEKHQQELQDKDKLLVEVQNELKQIKLSKELVSCGFEENDIESIIKGYQNGDIIEFVQTFAPYIKKLIDNKIKVEKETFQRSATLPSTDSGNLKGNNIDPFVQGYLSKKNNGNTEERLKKLLAR